MPETFFTDDDLRAKLREAIGQGGQRAFARQRSIDHTMLSRILAGKRPVGGTVANVLGYTATVGHTYIALKGQAVDGVRHGFKFLTHDFRSPLQRGEPIWDGVTIPYTLPSVALDTSRNECGAGWNYCASIADAIPIAGLWATGRPSVVCAVEASQDAIQRGNKRRASGLTILGKVSAEEMRHGIGEFSAVFTPHANEMMEEQAQWFTALRGEISNSDAVATGLRAALKTRELSWTLKEFKTARDAWASWAARDAWGARDAWDAWGAWDARDAWAAWGARASWGARDARAARAARDAWAALTWCFAAKNAWVFGDPGRYTVGIRDAYANGLGIAVPLSDGVLGWAMDGVQ